MGYDSGVCLESRPVQESNRSGFSTTQPIDQRTPCAAMASGEYQFGGRIAAGVVPHALAKSGLILWTKQLALELGRG